MTTLGLFAHGRRERGSRTVPGRRLTRVGSGPPLILVSAFVLLGCGPSADVEDPVPLYGDVPIEYPLRLWDADVEGETLLRIRVTETGSVDSVEVFETSGYPAFDSAAVRGALQLRYSPARRGGKRVEVWAKVPIQFTKPGQ